MYDFPANRQSAIARVNILPPLLNLIKYADITTLVNSLVDVLYLMITACSPGYIYYKKHIITATVACCSSQFIHIKTQKNCCVENYGQLHNNQYIIKINFYQRFKKFDVG